MGKSWNTDKYGKYCWGKDRAGQKKPRKNGNKMKNLLPTINDFSIIGQSE